MPPSLIHYVEKKWWMVVVSIQGVWIHRIHGWEIREVGIVEKRKFLGSEYQSVNERGKT